MFFELKNLLRFFKLPKEQKEIVFYAEHGGYYPSFEGILKELDIQSDKQVCYITSDINDPILKNDNYNNNCCSKINSFYIKKFLSLFMVLVNCKVFVLTLTDLNKFHLKRSINDVKYVYVFHALVSSHMMYRDGAFDHYDTILCVGPHHEKEIRKREKDLNLKPKKLIQGGYYRLERISNNYKSLSLKQTGKNVLIAPSWGPLNIIESCGIEVVKRLLDLDYKVTLRPHPEIIRRNPEILKEYFDKFADNKNFILETNVAGDESMLKADLLITDLSGIALEYAFGTNRPVLFIDLPKKIQNKNYKDLGIEPLELSIRDQIGVLIKTSELNNIGEIVRNLIQQKDFYKEKIEKIKSQSVYEFGNSSRIGAREILEYLK